MTSSTTHTFVRWCSLVVPSHWLLKCCVKRDVVQLPHDSLATVCNPAQLCHESLPRLDSDQTQVAFHDLVLSLDGEGGWAVYRGKRAAERDGDGDEASSYAEVAMSSSAPDKAGENLPVLCPKALGGTAA